jgi:hypothetical protein
MVKIRKTTRLKNGQARRKIKKRFDTGLVPHPKMRIDNSNLKHAVRQLFDVKLTYCSQKINNNSLKDGTTIEKVEMYFEDFLANSLKYASEDSEKKCSCMPKHWNVYGRCLTISGVGTQYPVCITYNTDTNKCELYWK